MLFWENNICYPEITRKLTWGLEKTKEMKYKLR